MKVVFTDTFFKSFKENIIDANKWYKFKFWQHKWWDLQRGISNLIAYFKVIYNLHPYDADYPILSLTKISLERLLPYIENGNEIEKDRLPKIKNINRTIELINNYLEDNYAERCGWKFDESELSEQSVEDNLKALKKGYKLEKEEWDELFDLLKQMRNWWD